MSDFVHLHTHTDNSPLDGMSSVADIVNCAVADGQKAVAITDHGSLAGTLELGKRAAAAGIKGIGGQEMYLAVGSRFNEDSYSAKGDSAESTKTRYYQHLTVLAQNQTGWTNLVQLNNDAMNHYKSAPRTDYAALKQYGDGLILGTGCIGGPVQQALINAEDSVAGYRLARAEVEKLLECVDGDTDRVFVEVMDHSIDLETKVLPDLVRLAKDFGLRIVATNDAHFPHAENAADHDHLLAISVNKKFDEPRFQFKGDGSYWMATEAHMRRVFPERLGGQDVVANSSIIADMVSDNLAAFMPINRMRLPKFPIPQEFIDAFNNPDHIKPHFVKNAAQLFLFDKIKKGAIERFGVEENGQLPRHVAGRLTFEMEVVNGFDFEDYFLMVSDLTDAVRAQGFVHGPGRGSAAGSLAMYCLRVTDVNPLDQDLLFERFLDVFRKGFPDVDLDFPKSMDNWVMEYFMSKYGADNVARIGTHSTQKTRAILGHIGRLSGYPSEGDRLKKALPAKNSADLTLREYMDPESMPRTKERDVKRYRAALSEGVAIRELVSTNAEKNPIYNQIVKQAIPLENVRSGVGIHACGIVVSDAPLTDLVPMRIDKKTGNKVTLWTAPELEGLGFVKMDALTIDNLDVVIKTVAGIQRGTGEIIDISYGKLPMDPETSQRAARAWATIQRGDTSGLFQIEGSGITAVAMDVVPESLADLSAVVALYRPGPMGAGMPARFAARKNGREPATYDYLTKNPAEAQALATVLDKSYGVVVVQEDLMNLSRVVAGFGPGRRNRLRKAFSKKNADEMAILHDDFIAGGLRQTTASVEDDWEDSIPFERTTLDALWQVFEASASYLFNASHSAPYAYLAYIEAYLKANWPAYFGAALLSVKESVAARLSVLHSIRRSGVTVMAPDVNESGLETQAIDDHTIRLGLGEIRGVRTNAEAIVAEREKNGEFADLYDLITRVEEEKTTKRNIKNNDGDIVDTVEKTAMQKLSLATVESLIDSGACDSFGHPRRGMHICVRALRTAPDVEIPDVEYGDIERAVRERRGLGIVTSTHPTALMRDAREESRRNQTLPIGSLRPNPQAEVAIDAVIAHVLIKRGQSGHQRAHLVLEDYSGATEAVMWSRTLDDYTARNGAPPAEGDIVNARVIVKTMTRIAESDDDAPETSDSAVMEEERLDVIIRSITKCVDLDFGGARELPGEVKHPLEIAATLPQTAISESEAFSHPEAKQTPVEPVEALSEASDEVQGDETLAAGSVDAETPTQPVENVTINVPHSAMGGKIKLKRWLTQNCPQMSEEVIMWFARDASSSGDPTAKVRGPYLGYTLISGGGLENDE